MQLTCRAAKNSPWKTHHLATDTTRESKAATAAAARQAASQMAVGSRVCGGVPHTTCCSRPSCRLTAPASTLTCCYELHACPCCICCLQLCLQVSHVHVLVPDDATDTQHSTAQGNTVSLSYCSLRTTGQRQSHIGLQPLQPHMPPPAVQSHAQALPHLNRTEPLLHTAHSRSV